MAFPSGPPGLIQPQCIHFGVCGGCKFQHVPYEAQLIQKETLIRDLFGSEVEPILPCPFPWRYRNKMEFSFSQSKKGDKFLGLMKKRGRVENLEMCLIANPWFTQLLKRVREWWESSEISAYHPPTDRGSLRTLTLREGIHTGEKMAVLTVSGNPDFALNSHELEGFEQAVGEIHSLILRKQVIAKKTPTRFEEHILRGNSAIHEKLHDQEGNPYLFRIRAASFFQPNTLQAELLYQKVLGCAEVKPDDTIWDLYCGTGTLGIFSAKKAKTVWGIEMVPEAVEDAQANILLNGVKNMRVVQEDVGKGSSFPPPATVILDPPRCGLSETALKFLLEAKPKKIIYVSCNPTTQVENCRVLLENGYQIIRLIPVDQFPHTPHVENMAVLRMKS